LADLFLGNFEKLGSDCLNNASDQGLDKVFSNILDNSLTRQSDLRKLDLNELPRLGLDRETSERLTPLEDLSRKLEAIGVPLEALSVNKEDLGRLAKVLADSGYDAQQISETLAKISDGPLTMDKVLAKLKSAKKDSKSNLQMSEDSLPMLGLFLQQVGLNSETVKDILSGVKAGQKFGASELKQTLLKNGDFNLKSKDLSEIDTQNLKDLLKSLGLSEQDTKAFWTRMEKTGGKISLEGFLGFLQSVERPETLTAAQSDNVRQFMKNMLLNNSLRQTPYFNKILCLLQSMGDQEIDERFLSANPAIQALRGGAISAQTLAKGAASGGPDSVNQASLGPAGKSSQNSWSLSAADSKTMGQTITSKTEAAPLPSKLSDSVVKQVVEKIVYQVRNNQHRIQIQLSPRNLGNLNINLVMKNNTLHASIVAENPMVMQALEEHLTQLKQDLAQQGLNLERFNVSCNNQRRQDDSDGGQKQSKRFSTLLGDGPETVEPISSSTTNSLTQSGLVDTHI
jgi:flagellar hook-length control protein FliK